MKPASQIRVNVSARLLPEAYERLRRVAFDQGVAPGALMARVLEKFLNETAPDKVTK